SAGGRRERRSRRAGARAERGSIMDIRQEIENRFASIATSNAIQQQAAGESIVTAKIERDDSEPELEEGKTEIPKGRNTPQKLREMDKNVRAVRFSSEHDRYDVNIASLEEKHGPVPAKK